MLYKNKFTMKQARAIRDSSLSLDELAVKYHVSRVTIWRILRGETYQEEGMKLREFDSPGRKRKITKEDIPVIIDRYWGTDDTQAVIAMDYGVNNQTISKIITGERA